jgi:glycosyltransferase involved in cell wall biosynthesis
MMRHRVVFIPDLEALRGNPYWTILGDGLAAEGVDVVMWSGDGLVRWLYRRREQAVILHLHFVQHLYAYQGSQARLRWVLRMARNLWLARLMGHRVVFTLHNSSPSYPLRPRFVDELGQRVAVAAADCVIVHCESAKDLLAATYGRRSGVHVVPHPHYIGLYDDQVSRPEARHRFGFSASDYVLGFVGQIRPNKGVEELLRVFTQRTESRLRLLIAGAVPQEDHVAHELRMAAQNDSRISLRLGRLPSAELQWYYRAADAMVFPFREVLTSSSVVTALSFGCAVVIPRVGCLSEVPDDAALLYDPTVPDGLLTAIDRVIELDTEQLGRAGRHFMSRFSREDFVRSTAEVYRMARDRPLISVVTGL